MTPIFSRFALLSCLLFSMLPSAVSAQSFNPAPTAGFGEQTRQFLPVDQAFAFNFIQNAQSLELSWQITPGYYLYQDRISISSEDIEPGAITMRDGQEYHDEFFGDVKIFTEPLTVTVDLPALTQDAEITVRYQGCAKAGFCYPPEVKKVPLSALTGAGSSTPPAAQTTSEKPVTEHAGLAASLADNWWTPLLFLALGVGLAFTPCVLPMYPILTSIVLGSGQLSQRRALGLSFIYVQGMALTYTLLGLVVASAGLQFQAAMQHPYVLIGLSALFIALSLSMFGLYTLQLPAGMQTWLSGLSNRQQGGSGAGVFAMGAISGLVCSPCTTAPLSGALLYVAQSGDLLTGGVALYALALGMGIPLIGAAVFGNKLLPKAGGWMDKVKILFGFVLLAAPVFLLERILPEIWTQALWSALGITAFGWLYHSKNSLPFGGWKQTTVGIIAVLGMLASAQPMLDQVFRPQAVAEAAQPGQFIRVSSLEELNQQLAAAKAAGKPVMLDFYADWCVACKEFEKYTFHQPDVAAKLDQFVLLQADVTKSSPQDTKLLSTLSVLGLPTIDFWDADGNRLEAKRLTGFMPAEPFAEHIENL